MSALMNLFVATHVRLYRATDGKMGGGLAGGKVLLLTTVGNKSGKERTAPLMYFVDQGKTYIVASAGGAPQHPAWYKNLVAKSDVTVQVGARKYRANAITVDKAERDSVFEKVKAQMKQFAGYEKKAGREIPIVRLDEAA